MSKLSDQFKGKRNWMEKVVEFIPGFSGYLDKNRRREADKKLREYIVSQFKIEQSNLEDIREEQTDEGNLDAIGKVDKLLRLLEQVFDKIRYADRGYSGFFDEVKIKEAELEKLYAYDYSLLEDVQSIKSQVSELSSEYSEEKVKEINNTLKDIDRKINERKNLFLNISGT